MSYATQQNLIDRYGEDMLVSLTDRAATATGLIDEAVITRALTDTDAFIDGFVMARYSLPLASTPAILTDLAQVIAIYKLHRQISNEKIRIDYEDAVKRLKDIQSGGFLLNVAGIEPAASTAGSVETNGTEPAFTGGSMPGFM